MSVLFAGPYHANPFDPAIRVNDTVITVFDLEQRQGFLAFLGATGNLRALAEEQLIQDRIRIEAGRQQGVSVSQDDVFQGMEEFASRGDLSAEELISIIEAQGIYRETYEDFIEAGLYWRQVLSSRFAFRGAVTDAELNTSLALGTANQQAIELRLAEIVLPYASRGQEGAAELAASLRREIVNGGNFAVLAAQYSETPTAAEGGLRDWISINALGEDVVGPLIAAGVGSLSDPVEVGNAMALFQLRGIRTNSEAITPTTIEYMTVPLLGATNENALSEAREILNDVDTCNDLRADANDLAENLYILTTLLERAAPPRYRSVLADLDLNEAKVVPASNGGYEIVMVCSRESDLQEDALVRLRSLLGNQRVESFGDAYLQELIGNATITRF